MKKLKPYSKIVPIILIISLLFTACDVPDISKFTEQSAEMTRGIRTSVKETEGVLKISVEKKELFNSENRVSLDKNLKNYQNAMKPTLKVLDSLDTYLEALNALAQANKKSEENSKAVVSSVSSLVTAVSGIQLAGTAVNIVTGLVTLGEQFRTVKDFKKRVNIAADIVEGRYREDVTYPLVDGVPKKTIVMKKVCTDEVNNEGEIIVKLQIEEISQKLVKRIKEIQDNAAYSAKEKEILIKSLRDQADKEVYQLGCGVIDLLKFTLQDLKVINGESLKILFSNYREKNDTILDFREALVANDIRVQKELKLILEFKALISTLRREYRGTRPLAEQMETARNTLDSIFFHDGQLKISINKALKECNTQNNKGCGKMSSFLNVDSTNIEAEIRNVISSDQWETGISTIETVLDTRASGLFEQNQKYLADLERITPSYTAVKNELKTIKDKQAQMEKLIDANIEALDAWRESHSNLRMALNTKKPLSVTRLASKVKEIWAIIDSKE